MNSGRSMKRISTISLFLLENEICKIFLLLNDIRRTGSRSVYGDCYYNPYSTWLFFI